MEGILRAQALLRIIWNIKNLSKCLMLNAFTGTCLVSQRWKQMFADSARGCIAADDNIWASQFMTDFMFQWSRYLGPL